MKDNIATSELKIPTTIKVMFLLSLLLHVYGLFLDNGFLAATGILALIILSCAVSILEGVHKGFNELSKQQKDKRI